jgi:hypothetical protein
VDSFETVERLLGRNWINAQRFQSGVVVTGTAPTLAVVSMGQRLRVIENRPGAQELIERVRIADRASLAELTAIYLACPSDVEMEIEPHVAVGDRNRRPDFRLRTPGEDWIYVEVAAPDVSAAQARAQLILNRIGHLLAQVPRGTAVEVFLRREPTDDEVGVIAGHVDGAMQSRVAGIYNVQDLALVAVNQSPPGQIVVHDYDEEPRPRLGVARSEVIAGQTTKHIAVRIPFTDERAEAFLTSEARQLPTTAPGLLMIDMSGTPGSFKAWEQLIRRRLQPKQHTRVGAVCLFEAGLLMTSQGENWVPQSLYISNPYARFSLPDWLRTRLSSFVWPQSNAG